MSQFNLTIDPKARNKAALQNVINAYSRLPGASLFLNVPKSRRTNNIMLTDNPSSPLLTSGNRSSLEAYADVGLPADGFNQQNGQFAVYLNLYSQKPALNILIHELGHFRWDGFGTDARNHQLAFFRLLNDALTAFGLPVDPVLDLRGNDISNTPTPCPPGVGPLECAFVDSRRSDVINDLNSIDWAGALMPFNGFSKFDYWVTENSGALQQENFYSGYLDWASTYLVNSIATLSSFGSTLFTLPIGAFYESRSPGADPAPSIAAKTPVLLDAAGRRMSEAGLYALDANHDGKLSGGELASLRAWIDTGEDGVAKPGEIVTAAAAGLTEIDHVNYIYYTLGNAVAAQAAIAAPTKPSDAQAIASPWLPNSSVPDSLSLYQSLRYSNNVFWVPSGGYITWQPTQIKINSNDPSYLIGTDANDSFDARYYAAYDGMYFNLGLLNKFLGGPGNDTVGGSTRADTVWGGTGDDVLAHASGRTAFTLSDGSPIRGAARITRADGIKGAARRRRRAARARTCAAGATALAGGMW